MVRLLNDSLSYIPNDVLDEANRIDTAKSWADTQRSSLAQMWGESWMKQGQDLFAGIGGALGSAGEAIVQSYQQLADVEPRKQGATFLGGAIGGALGRVGEEFETEGASVAAAATELLQSEINRSERIKSEGVPLWPGVKVGGTGEAVRQTDIRTDPAGMGRQGFVGTPRIEETTLGGAERQQALERARQFEEENPQVAFLGGLAAPVGFPLEIGRAVATGLGAAKGAAGLAGLAMGGVRKVGQGAKTAADSLAAQAEGYIVKQFGATPMKDAHNAAWIGPSGKLIGDLADHQDSATATLDALGIPAANKYEAVKDLQSRTGIARLSITENDVNVDIVGAATEKQVQTVRSLVARNRGGSFHYDITDPASGKLVSSGSDLPSFLRDAIPEVPPAPPPKPPIKQPWEATLADLDTLFPRAGDIVDGRTVGERVANLSSIESSIDNPTVIRGIREVPMAEFGSDPPKFYSVTEEQRTKNLAASIKASGRIDPLIVAYDAEGPYILEGGHRFDALKMLGAKSFPAKVVLDEDSLYDAVDAALREGKSVRPEVLAEYSDLAAKYPGATPPAPPPKPPTAEGAGVPPEVPPTGASTIRPFGRVEEGAAARAPFEEAAAVPRPSIPRAQTEAKAAVMEVTPDLVDRVAAQPLGEKATTLTALRQTAAGLWEKHARLQAELKQETIAGQTATDQMADIVVKQGIIQQAEKAANAVTEAAKREASETGRALNSMLIAVNGRLADRVAQQYGQVQQVLKDVTGEIAGAARKNGSVGKNGQQKIDDLKGYLQKEVEGTAAPEVRLPGTGETATEAAARGRTAATKTRAAVSPRGTAEAMKAVKAVDAETQLWRRYIDLNREAGESRLGVGARDTAAIEAERAAVRDQLYAALEEKIKAVPSKAKPELTPEEIANAAKDKMAAGIRSQWQTEIRAKNSPFKDPKFAGDIGQKIENDLMKALAKDEQNSQTWIAKMSMEIEKAMTKELGGLQSVKSLVSTLKSGGSATAEAFAKADSDMAELLKRRPDLADEIARMRERVRKAEARNAFSQASDIRAMEATSIRLTARETLDFLDRFQKAAPGTPEYRQYANDVLRSLSKMGTEAKAETRRHFELANRAKVRRLLTEEEKLLGSEERATRVDELSRQLARFTKDDWADPRGFQMFANAMKKEGAFDKAHRYRLGSMLSGVPTMVLNFAGAGLETGIAPIVRGLSGVAERVAPVQKGAVNATERMALDEIEGWAEGFGTAASEAIKTWNTGVGGRIRADVQGMTVGSMKNPLTWPLRLLQVSDDFWYTLNFSSVLKAETRLESRKTGKSMDAIRLDLVRHPEVVDRAAEQAARRTYTQDVGQIGKAINRLRDNPAGKTVVPFFNTIAAMAELGAERSILPSASGFFQAGKYAKAGDFERAAQRRGEAMLGSGIMAAAGIQAANGNITGYGPTDPTKRRDWLDQGGQPYSIRIGDKWVSYANWGSLIIPLALAASAVEAVQEGVAEKSVTAGLVQGVKSFGALWLDVNALRGFSDALNAMTDPKRYGERFLESIALSYTSPGFSSSLARVFDPEQKDPAGLMEAWLSRVPGLSRQIKPTLTQTGEPVTRQTGAGALLPFRTKTQTPNRVLQETEKLRGQGQEVGVGHVGGEIKNVKLTEKEAFSYDQLAGKLTRLKMLVAMGKPRYKAMPSAKKVEALQEARNEARDMARRVIEAKGGVKFQIRERLAR